MSGTTGCKNSAKSTGLRRFTLDLSWVVTAWRKKIGFKQGGSTLALQCTEEKVMYAVCRKDLTLMFELKGECRKVFVDDAVNLGSSCSILASGIQSIQHPGWSPPAVHIVYIWVNPHMRNLNYWEGTKWNLEVWHRWREKVEWTHTGCMEKRAMINGYRNLLPTPEKIMGTGSSYRWIMVQGWSSHGRRLECHKNQLYRCLMRMLVLAMRDQTVSMMLRWQSLLQFTGIACIMKSQFYRSRGFSYLLSGISQYLLVQIGHDLYKSK